MPTVFLALLVVSALAGAGYSAEVMYETDVRPILKTHCFQCHGERDTAEGNLDLRLRRLIAKGGDSGPAIVPGDVDKSLLHRRVATGEMPPDDDKRLSAKEVAIIRRWIEANAPTVASEPESFNESSYFTETEKQWWAFQAVRTPDIPSTPFETRNPIDAFILKELDKLAVQNPGNESAFQLSPIAGRTTLIRRVYLDMLGVPPHPSAIQRFVADNRPDAWSRVVDSVLSSPRYGERWGRHWLDVAGFADSEGYTDKDVVREHAYRYRDYVIRALNQDKPYSEFVTEQLAGDELVHWPDTTLRPEIVETLAATGFLRMASDGTASSGVDQDVARNRVIADTLQIVGTSLLGLSVHCAQCHDHRYDPIPQRDYYRLRAIFEPAFDWKNWRTPPDRLVSLYSDEDKKNRAEIEATAKKVDADRQERVDYYIEKTLEHELLMVAEELQQPLRDAFHTKNADRTDEQKKVLEDHVNIANITSGSLYLYDRRREVRAKDLDRRRNEKLSTYLEQVKTATLRSLDETVQREVQAAYATKPNERNETQRQIVAAHPAVGVTADTLATFAPKAAADLARYSTAAAEIRKFRIRDELQKIADQAKTVRDTIPKEHFLRILSEKPQQLPVTFVFHRGDHQQPKEPVAPQGLTVLDAPEILPVPDLSTSGRRLQFARYLTNGKHPLFARVLVNRIWAHHFGRGIVSTTSDFGVLGERPTHPELLDWLSAEFVESRWSVKRLHRLILTSRVYQQSAVGSAALVEVDPDNRLLGRWPLRRLESESVRDAILTVAGRLNNKMFGEPVPVMEDGVGQIVLGIENLDGERKPTKAIPLLGEEYRRSVYIQVRRTRPFGVLESFDLPDISPNCPDRSSSNVATQSLMLMNSDFVLAMSTTMAQRLIADRPDQPRDQLKWGWELAFGRQPTTAQLARADDFLKNQTKAFTDREPNNTKVHQAALATYCQALLGSNRFLYIE